MEERWRVAEAEARRIVEEKVTVAARWQAILDAEARRQAEVEEAVAEPDGGSPSKQKERAEGEPVVCNRCVTQGAKCQVSDQSSGSLFADGG